MTREELVELAALDVFGLLDHYEAALYTRSFHHAPAPVQDEIIQLQAELAGDSAMMADEMPAAELRQRVLVAVAKATEQENSKLAPIASIGSRRSTWPPSNHEPDRPHLMRILFGGSGQVWRAAAFALIGALVVLAYFYSDSVKRNDEIWRIAIDQHTLMMLDQQLPTIKDFLGDPTARSIHLASITGDADDDAWARVFIREGMDDAFLVVDGLESSEEAIYRIEVQDADGKSHVLANFQSKGRVSGLQLSLGGIQLGAKSVWIISTAAGPILRGV